MKDKTPEPPRPASLSDFIDRVINLLLSGLLAIPALFVIGILYLVHWLADTRPLVSFFYSGVRLGRDLNPFMMYKIRTLRVDTEFENQGVILPPDSDRELKLGKFLRDSRLDELPQLWNIIRGDMNMVGPRPLRPVIYEKLRKELSSCETRFQVKPGLTGYAQFLTPSRTPKRIRFAIDNYRISQGRQPVRDLILIFWTIGIVIWKAIKRPILQLHTRWLIFTKRGRGIEERKMVRYRSRLIWIQLTNVDFTNHTQSMIHIYDINPRAISFVSEQEFKPKEALYFYLIGCKECETGPKKKARCCGYVYKSYPLPEGSGPGKRHVIFYEPVSPIHRYLVDHYVLHETVA